MPPRQVEPVEALLTKRLGSYTHEYTERCQEQGIHTIH
jgi:hypothetical protein